MFKKNYDHLTKDTYFGLYKEATRGNPNYFLTYGNGKSAARIQDHLRPNGAHRWHNYMKTPKYGFSHISLYCLLCHGYSTVCLRRICLTLLYHQSFQYGDLALLFAFPNIGALFLQSRQLCWSNRLSMWFLFIILAVRSNWKRLLFCITRIQSFQT